MNKILITYKQAGENKYPELEKFNTFCLISYVIILSNQPTNQPTYTLYVGYYPLDILYGISS
jgi:hypothetical protein